MINDFENRTSDAYWVSLTTVKKDSPLACAFRKFSLALSKPIRHGEIEVDGEVERYRIRSFNDQFQSAADWFLRKKLENYNFSEIEVSYPTDTKQLGFSCKEEVLLFRSSPKQFVSAVLNALFRWHEDFYVEVQTHSEKCSEITVYVRHSNELFELTEGGPNPDVIYCDAVDAEELVFREDYTGKEIVRSWEDYWLEPSRVRQKAIRRVKKMLPWAE